MEEQQQDAGWKKALFFGGSIAVACAVWWYYSRSLSSKNSTKQRCLNCGRRELLTTELICPQCKECTQIWFSQLPKEPWMKDLTPFEVEILCNFLHEYRSD